MNQAQSVNPFAAKATLVGEEDRMNFLPFYFGTRYMLAGEAAVYDSLKFLTGGGYSGGYWNFYEVDSGTFYMAPKSADSFVLSSPNGNEATVSADAAGLTATLWALHALAEQTQSQEFADMHSLLYAYASKHAEFASIEAVID